MYPYACREFFSTGNFIFTRHHTCRIVKIVVFYFDRLEFLTMESKEKIDSRFKVANREALIGIGLVVFNFIWWFGFAYGLGSKNPEDYTYVLGFPAWFFYSCILGFVVMAVLTIIVVKFFFKDIPLEDDE